MLCVGSRIPNGSEPSRLHHLFVRQLSGREGALGDAAGKVVCLSNMKPVHPPVVHLGKCVSISYNRVSTLASQSSTLQ